MASVKLQKLLFLQGGKCFFCGRQLAEGEGSIEHLVAKSLGGTDALDNLVAICKNTNALMEDMSVKQKLQLVLNQSGTFSCPTFNVGAGSRVETKIAPKGAMQYYSYVVNNLHKRGKARPQSMSTLEATIKALLPKTDFTDVVVSNILNTLLKNNIISFHTGKLTYHFKDYEFE